MRGEDYVFLLQRCSYVVLLRVALLQFFCLISALAGLLHVLPADARIDGQAYLKAANAVVDIQCKCLTKEFAVLGDMHSAR